jgi:hypothetical protein
VTNRRNAVAITTKVTIANVIPQSGSDAPTFAQIDHLIGAIVDSVKAWGVWLAAEPS